MVFNCKENIFALKEVIQTISVKTKNYSKLMNHGFLVQSLYIFTMYPNSPCLHLQDQFNLHNELLLKVLDFKNLCHLDKHTSPWKNHHQPMIIPLIISQLRYVRFLLNNVMSIKNNVFVLQLSLLIFPIYLLVPTDKVAVTRKQIRTEAKIKYPYLVS